MGRLDLYSDQRQRARDAAFRLLAVRARTAAELKSRLLQKGFAAQLIEQTLTDFQAKGYQSDEEFARLFAREKQRSSGWGPARIRRELTARGVKNSLVEKTLTEQFDGVDLTESAYRAAAKKWRSMQGTAGATRKRRLTGFLQRRGYVWETINAVMNKLLEEDASHQVK